MSELDEVKEILNTLRVAMSLSFGMLVIVVSGIIKRFDDANIDSIFWLGTLFSFSIRKVETFAFQANRFISNAIMNKWIIVTAVIQSTILNITLFG